MMKPEVAAHGADFNFRHCNHRYTGHSTLINQKYYGDDAVLGEILHYLNGFENEDAR